MSRDLVIVLIRGGRGRSIYYQSMHVFASQRASDRVVDQLVALLGCKNRSQLGVVASPRGLVAGDITITQGNAAAIESCAGQTTLIPPDIVTYHDWHLRLPIDRKPIYVLIVEKESVFKTLVQLQQRSRSSPRRTAPILLCDSIILTGRGYADQATRTLVTLLAASCAPQRLRFVGLFDCDPYGIDIHRQYRQACPTADIQWLGVTLAHFLPGPTVSTSSEATLVPLRNDERLKAVSMLRKLASANEAASLRDSHVARIWM